MTGLSCTEIIELIRRTLTSEQIERSVIYWNKSVHQAHAPIEIGPQTFAMPFEGTVIFVDLAPGANWVHPCLYMLVDTDALNTKVIEAAFPPSIDQSAETYIAILRFGQELR